MQQDRVLGFRRNPHAPAPEPLPEPPKPSITIEFATDAYLANREGRDIAPATLRKYKTFVKQLREFAGDKGYVMLEQLEITDMDEFYYRWKDGIRARAKELERLKGFFKFCVKREWIMENPASDLDAPVLFGRAFLPYFPTARRGHPVLEPASSGRWPHSTRDLREGRRALVSDAGASGSPCERFCHRDYSLAGGAVSLAIYDERLDRDASNFGGTFEFSDLQSFAANRPFVFRINRGDPQVSYRYNEYSYFVEDQMQLRPQLTLTLGLRHDLGYGFIACGM